MTAKRHAFDAKRHLQWGVALLCFGALSTQAMASDQAQVEIIVAGRKSKLSRLAYRALCPALRRLGLGARFEDGSRCGSLEKHVPCRSLILAIADPSSDHQALMATIQRARHARKRPARLVVLKVEGSDIPPALDELADLLDNQRKDQSAVALSARNEAEAREVLLAALEAVWVQERPAPSVAVHGSSILAEPPNLAVALTRFPLQHGELRLSSPTGKMLWSAGRKLASLEPRFRHVYSASPKLAGGRAIPLTAGREGAITVNLRGGGDFGPLGLVHLWPGGPRAAPAPELLRRFVLEELVGKSRRWHLAPVAGPPALVGAPPWRPTMEGRARFAARYSRTPSHLFLTTRDGLLHAFDAKTGRESFVFVPAQLLTRLFAFASRQRKNPQPSLASAFRLPTTPPRVADLRYEGTWTTALVYAAGSVLTFLDVRAKPPRALPLSTPLGTVSRGQRWLTPALASHAHGGLWIAASQRPLTGHEGRLQISKLPAQSPSSGPIHRSSFQLPTQAVMEVDSQTRRMHAVALADGLGNLWRLAAPTFSPTRIAQLGPRHPFHAPPAVFRRDARSLIAAISQGTREGEANEAQLVIWRKGKNALICPLSRLCGCRETKSTPCNAPPPRLVAHTRPLIVAHPSGVEILALLARKDAGCPTPGSWLLRVKLDPLWNLHGVTTRRLGASGARQLSIVEHDLVLVEAKAGQRARLRLFGPAAPRSPAGRPHIETYRELY